MEEQLTFITSSSTEKSCIEDFSWVADTDFPNEKKLNNLEYPLNDWLDIIYNENFKHVHITDIGIQYQKVVNQVLKGDIFKFLDFHEEKNGVIDFKFESIYKVDYQLLKQKTISPDFFVYKIPRNDFIKLLDLRKYMMIIKNKIPKNKKYISILGEIKTSKYSSHKKTTKREDYLKFIQLVNTIPKSEELIVLMHICDESYYLFKNEFNVNSENVDPIIYGYIPKIYYENRYNTYNYLIESLKYSREKIELKNKNLKKKITKRQLLIKINSLEKRNKYLCLINSLLLVIIIAYIIKNYFKL